MVAEGHDHLGGAAQAGAGADEHVLRPGSHEPVHQLLGQPPVDLGDPGRDPLLSVPARVVHVGVQAVLVGAVAVAPVLLSEPAAAGAAQVPDDQARGVRVGGGVLPGDPQQHLDQPVGPVPAPGPVRAGPGDRVDGDEVGPGGRQLDPPGQPPPVGSPERPRPPPHDRRLGRPPPFGDPPVDNRGHAAPSGPATLPHRGTELGAGDGAAAPAVRNRGGRAVRAAAGRFRAVATGVAMQDDDHRDRGAVRRPRPAGPPAARSATHRPSRGGRHRGTWDGSGHGQQGARGDPWCPIGRFGWMGEVHAILGREPGAHRGLDAGRLGNPSRPSGGR